jgi:hypothetical protein
MQGSFDIEIGSSRHEAKVSPELILPILAVSRCACATLRCIYLHVRVI